MSSLAVMILPGPAYSASTPLLRYSAALLAQHGSDVLHVTHTHDFTPTRTDAVWITPAFGTPDVHASLTALTTVITAIDHFVTTSPEHVE